MSAFKDLVSRLATIMPAFFIVLVLGAVSVALVTAPQLPEGSLSAAVLPGAVFALTNSERTEEGITAFTRNTLLDRAAQMKAEDMAKKGYYAHVSPEGLTPMHWVEKAGYNYLMVGENLVVNRDSAKEAVDAFMGSTGHRANILRSEFTEIGVGVAQGTYKNKPATFIVQIFAKPRVQTSIVQPPRPPQAVAVAKVTPPPAPKPVPVLVETKVVREIKKVVAPVIATLQATTTFATSTPTTTEAFEPIFSVSIPAPIEVGYSAVVLPQPIPWQERLLGPTADLWMRIQRLWN